VVEQDEDGNSVHTIINSGDDELKEIEAKYKLTQVLSKRFLMNNEWEGQITNLLQYRVMRYPQII